MTSCDFGAFLDEALRDHLVCGLQNSGHKGNYLLNQT